MKVGARTFGVKSPLRGSEGDFSLHAKFIEVSCFKGFGLQIKAWEATIWPIGGQKRTGE
jgi:hypothetical protein